MIKKNSILFLGALSIVCCFAACNVDKLFTDDEIDLLLLNKSAVFVDSLETVLKQFEEENGCEVRIHNLQETNIEIILDYINNNPDSSDIIELDRWNLYSLASGKLLNVLNDSLFLSIPGQLTAQSRYGNMPVGYPWLTVSRRLYVNREIAGAFKVQINSPLKWGDFQVVLERLSGKPETRAFGLNILDKHEFFGFFVYAGNLLAPGFADSLAAMRFTEEQIISVFQLLNELRPYSEIGSSDEILHSFSCGAVASLIESPLRIFDLRVSNPKLKISDYPAPTGNSGIAAGIETISLGLNSNFKNRELSVSLMKFLYANAGKFGCSADTAETEQAGKLPGSRAFAGNAKLYNRFFSKAAYSYIFDKYYYREHFANLKFRLEEEMRKTAVY